jgi:hypothetical protein
MMKFEYLLLEARLYERTSVQLEQQLNELGNEGWDLVATCGVHGQTFVFKRAVSAAAVPSARKKLTTTK